MTHSCWHSFIQTWIHVSHLSKTSHLNSHYTPGHIYQYNLYFSFAHFSSKCNTIRHSLLHLFLPALGRVLKEGHNSSIFKILAQKLVEIFCMHLRLILYIMCPYLAQSYAYSLLLKNVNKEHLIIK